MKKEYFSNLDILRFLAFFVVFANHISSFLHFPASVGTPGTAAFTYLQIGDIGVAFFFVLSGFLITYFLEKEREQKGDISLRNFYVRRVLRIWPLYFLALGTIVAISLSFQGFALYKTYVDWREVLWHLFFIGNVFRAFHHTSNEMIAVLWSVAVEEQFYLVWPILFKLGRKYFNCIILLGVIISMAYRYHYANQFEVREFFTFTVMIYLFAGAFIGVHGKKIRSFFEGRGLVIGTASFAGVAALLSVRGLVFPYSYPQWFIALDGLIFALLFALIILSASYGGGEASNSRVSRVFRYLGSISYGLYVYHLIALTTILFVAGKLGFNYYDLNAWKFFGLAAAVLSFTILIASVSYRYFEKPFLRLKERLSFSL